jgi:hypothetical protein
LIAAVVAETTPREDRFVTSTPAESLTVTRKTSATVAATPITAFSTLAESVAAAPKNVTFSVPRIAPDVAPVTVIVATPDEPSLNTWM